MKSFTSKTGRHLIFRLDAGELLPEVLISALRDEAVTCGWVRASGVLADVELRAFGSTRSGHAPARKIPGPVQVVTLEGSVGISEGDVSLGLRAVIAREGDRGMDTLSGEIVAARVVGLEVIVNALDDVAIPRVIDRAAGVWLLGEADPSIPVMARVVKAPEAKAQVRPAAAPGPSLGWNEATSAITEPREQRAPNAPRNPSPSGPIPQRPARPAETHDDSPTPDVGDVVEHFAFGRCEVVKSEGDRLHLRVGKDPRVREIALEMLRVIALESPGPGRLFRLERRM